MRSNFDHEKLNVCLRKKQSKMEKQQLLEIVSMLTALVSSLMARIREELGENFDFLEQEKEPE